MLPIKKKKNYEEPKVCFIEERETNMYWVPTLCIFHIISLKSQYLKKYVLLKFCSILLDLFRARLQVSHLM